MRKSKNEKAWNELALMKKKIENLSVIADDTFVALSKDCEYYIDMMKIKGIGCCDYETRSLNIISTGKRCDINTCPCLRNMVKILNKI